jgi:hypothetical protein
MPYKWNQTGPGADWESNPLVPIWLKPNAEYQTFLEGINFTSWSITFVRIETFIIMMH